MTDERGRATSAADGGKALFEYKIVKAGTHTGLETEINQAAADGWEPVAVYAWNTGWTSANHAVLLRRPAPRAFQAG